MLVLHNPKHHHHFIWQQVTIRYYLACMCKVFSSTKGWVRVSHKEHHRDGEFHVILRERIGRDGDVEVSPGKVASLAFKKSNR